MSMSPLTMKRGNNASGGSRKRRLASVNAQAQWIMQLKNEDSELDLFGEEEEVVNRKRRRSSNRYSDVKSNYDNAFSEDNVWRATVVAIDNFSSNMDSPHLSFPVSYKKQEIDSFSQPSICERTSNLSTIKLSSRQSYLCCHHEQFMQNNLVPNAGDLNNEFKLMYESNSFQQHGEIDLNNNDVKYEDDKLYNTNNILREDSFSNSDASAPNTPDNKFIDFEPETSELYYNSGTDDVGALPGDLNNGWEWCGEAYEGTVFSMELRKPVKRTCYPAMQRRSIRPGVEYDTVMIRDCVSLMADGSAQQSYVAKVVALWQHPKTGGMMISALWFYRPEHTEDTRVLNHVDKYSDDELFASRHLDEISVACVEDKCYVLTYAQYCRHAAARNKVNFINPDPRIQINSFPKPALNLHQQAPLRVDPYLVYFSKQYYDIKLKRVLNKLPTPTPLYSTAKTKH